MAKRSKGFRNRTRNILRNRVSDKGRPPVTHSLRVFEDGARVSIVINPSIHAAMPHPRYQGRTGVVSGRRGNAFEVSVRAGSKHRLLIVGPEHLKQQP